MSYVIACGDEGVQINQGVRIGVVGAGVEVPRFSEVIVFLKKVYGEQLAVASSEENDWVKQALSLADWEQTNASAQQHTEALADREGLLYAGYLPFADPRQLKHEVKGHMVRPHGVHIANKIVFTLGGGEQTYNLGCYVISADWIADAPNDLVKEFVQLQIDFYQKLAGELPLKRVLETEGTFAPEHIEANKAKLVELGLVD